MNVIQVTVNDQLSEGIPDGIQMECLLETESKDDFGLIIPYDQLYRFTNMLWPSVGVDWGIPQGSQRSNAR